MAFFATKITYTSHLSFLLDPGIPGVRSMGPSLSKLRDVCLDLTDVTLADEDMQVMQIMQLCKLCKLCKLRYRI